MIENTNKGGGLTYDAASGQYTYYWQTQASWKGSCAQFHLRLNDQTDHIANFGFR